jgi:hypothetical protein
MTPDPPSWGSRGRRFKSGRPDAGQGLVLGFSCQLLAANGSARALPFAARTKRIGVFCRLGMLTSDYRHQRVRGLARAPLPPPRANFPPGQAVAGSDLAVKLVLGNNSRRRTAPTSARHFVPPGSPAALRAWPLYDHAAAGAPEGQEGLPRVWVTLNW